MSALGHKQTCAVQTSMYAFIEAGRQLVRRRARQGQIRRRRIFDTPDPTRCVGHPFASGGKARFEPDVSITTARHG
jgi:hypothetical protein